MSCFSQAYIHVQNKSDLITLVVALKKKMELLNHNLINSDKLRKMTEIFYNLKPDISITKTVNSLLIERLTAMKK